MRDYTGDDALALVLSLNLKRRQLSASELAFVALEIEKCEAEQAKIRQALNLERNVSKVALMPPSAVDAGKAREKAAAAVGVSPRYVQDAKKIASESPALADAVRSGEKTLTQAMREVKEIRREQRRDDNRGLIAQAPEPHASAAKFATIVIDPPWDWGDEGGTDQFGRARPATAAT